LPGEPVCDGLRQHAGVENVTDTMPQLLPLSVGYVPVGSVTTIGTEGVTTSPALAVKNIAKD